MNKKTVIIALTCLLGFSLLNAIAGGIADTPENRKQQAERYLQATPPKEMFADVAEKMGATLPPEARQKFIELFTSQLDIDALTKAMSDAMVKHFTADELSALADFYGSPVGKSAMKKFGAYMTDLMPVIQSEVMKAQAKAQQQAAPAPAPAK